jgi:hypothetical protein
VRSYEDLVRELERRERVRDALEHARANYRRIRGPHEHGTGLQYAFPSGSRARIYRGPCRCGELLMCGACGRRHCAITRCGPCSARAERTYAREARRGRTWDLDPVEYARAVDAIFKLLRSPDFRRRMRPTSPCVSSEPVTTTAGT